MTQRNYCRICEDLTDHTHIDGTEITMRPRQVATTEERETNGQTTTGDAPV